MPAEDEGKRNPLASQRAHGLGLTPAPVGGSWRCCWRRETLQWASMAGRPDVPAQPRLVVIEKETAALDKLRRAQESVPACSRMLPMSCDEPPPFGVRSANWIST